MSTLQHSNGLYALHVKEHQDRQAKLEQAQQHLISCRLRMRKPGLPQEAKANLYRCFWYWTGVYDALSGNPL